MWPLQGPEEGGGATSRSVPHVLHARKISRLHKKFGKIFRKKILKENMLEKKKLITKIYETINQCDTIFALQAQQEQREKQGVIPFYRE